MATIPVVREITGFINALTEDEQIDLVALMWLGRGDGRSRNGTNCAARRPSAATRRTRRYLLGEPLLGDYLADGLDAVRPDLDRRAHHAGVSRSSARNRR